MLLLTLRGTPTLYCGDEIGLAQADIPPELQQDPWGRNVPGMGRDGCRTPMQWSGAPGAGFTNPGVEPWLPLSDDAGTRNVEVLLSESGSLLNLYRRLLALRRQEPALQVGDYQTLPTQRGVFAYLRSAGQSRLAVALNFTDEATQAFTVTGSGDVVLSTELDRSGPESLDRLMLRPHEGVIIRLD